MRLSRSLTTKNFDSPSRSHHSSRSNNSSRPSHTSRQPSAERYTPSSRDTQYRSPRNDSFLPSDRLSRTKTQLYPGDRSHSQGPRPSDWNPRPGDGTTMDLRYQSTMHDIRTQPSSQSTDFFRVQGGTPPKASRDHIRLDSDNNPSISRSQVNVSSGDRTHAEYFKTKRPGSYGVGFQTDSRFSDFMRESAIPQKGYRTNPLNQGGHAPKIVDPTTPGDSYELPPRFSGYLESAARPKSGYYF